MTNITFDLRQGGGTLPLIGGVEFRPTRTVHAAANVVMPAPQTIGLHDGKGTMTGVMPTPAGSSPSWAYMATVVEGATNREWSWLVVVPDVPSIAFEALSRPVQVDDPVIDVGALAEAVDGAMKKVAVHPVTGDVTVTRMDGATYLAGNSKGPAGPPGPGIPDGGAAGQVPARTADGGTEWRGVASLTPSATPTTAGLLSGADKARLDALPTTATVDSKDSATLSAAKAYTDAYHPPRQKNLPAGITDRPGTLDAATSVYTPDSFRGRSAREAIEGSKAGATLSSVINASAADRVTTCQIVYLGDSEVVGTGATVGSQDAAAQAMSQLRSAGYAMSDGVIICHDNNKDDGIANRDSRLTMTGTWTTAGIKSDPTKLDYQFHITSKVNGSTLTFSFAQACTQIDLYIFGNSASFTYQVDAGAVVTHTPGGQAGLEIVKIGNLSNAAHTLKVPTTSTANVYMLGARGLTPYSSEISKVGFWGAIAPAALPRTWWSATELLKATQPQAIVLQFGTNEALRSSYTVDQYKVLMLAAIANFRSTVPGAAIYLMSSFQPNVTDAVWTTWRNAQYDVADIAGIRLGDCVAKVGNRTTATAAGLYSDATHPNAAGYAKQGELLRQMLLL